MTSSSTTPTTPTRRDRADMRTVSSLFDRIETGHVAVRLPDGRRRAFGDELAPVELRCTIDVHRWSFFSRLLTAGSIGVGESYMDGDWDTDDLVALIRVVIANRQRLQRITASTLANILGAKTHHWSRRNTRDGSRRNIAEHYDLSNELYELFLDDTMTYSSALFTSPDQTLEAAQTAKYAKLAADAHIGPGHHVLEIGCGWGGFAEYAAGTLGARVTGITLSIEQAEYARARMQRLGLDDLVDIRVTDYRDVRGTYDRIVSIEMLEAVGHRYMSTYFATIERLLADDGLAAIQVITIPEQRYGRYLRRPDFIQKHIFPGGHIPSLEAMCAALGDETELYVESVDNINMSYAETLRRWRLRFVHNVGQVRELGFDERFCRMWEFYLAYCEGAFRARYINDLQLTLTRPMNPTLGAEPYGHVPVERLLRRVA